MNTAFDKYYRLGELTIARTDDGWIVLEDGRKVGGTVRSPFADREAAQRYIDRERADYEEDLAAGNYQEIAAAKIIRQTDPELWARVADIEQQHRDRSEDERYAIHAHAGTSIVLIRMVSARLEAAGDTYRDGTRDGEPVWRLTEQGRRRGLTLRRGLQ
jgi:hypothetical protein